MVRKVVDVVGDTWSDLIEYVYHVSVICLQVKQPDRLVEPPVEITAAVGNCWETADGSSRRPTA